MPRAKRVCPKPDCPNVARGRYCPEHERAYEQQRGTAAARGYGAAHRKLRAQWQAVIDTRPVTCPTCQQPITRGQRWDLGHTDDRTGYLGPQHADKCNRSEAGKASHRQPPGG